ncbi:hypothetical protein PTSG_11750 [Salpingoeca rosetta]|uniref:Kinesin-like protein n=1 Tax=Salpingoeca rosetta (strain ATCC 50818 / BSB-021) TaxID=946362 RepID=F2U0K7_SALR5|nr:uncharacterized protein PTSG_11750 [Salpingoeca rosetta]EGD80935.1 hypothetical protein PTSG_11750 [Salpingoeca rosetta]|eukprot:XP_004997496.1 hypothetical protein PTSG_11750 [Salpingoeca rosetta]
MSIVVYCRLKPTDKPYDGVELDPQDDCDILKIHTPRNTKDIVNHTREDYKFKFQKVFQRETSQDTIFNHVAKPVAESVIEGYNGTVFAYGQTGSGKTFTITGGAENYDQRGLIPRILEFLFQFYADHPDREFSTRVSYLEIYNENGYDLLGTPQQGKLKGMEDLPKINLMEGPDGDVHLNNLSQIPVETTEQALNALFVGDTNRMIAETPMNMASTRSHCIFTIYVTSRETGSSVWRKGKLHLVDLAGSERIKKTNVEGVLLTEAKYINLSLHYLEQVIVALSEKTRRHVPYRNSLLTSVLRDSLGGNCKTTMIATMSSEERNMAESISTGRFSQRVALVKNDARLNEELDPKLEIIRLKQEVTRLKAELALLSGDVDMSEPLTDEEKEALRQMVDTYVSSTAQDADLVLGDMRKIQYCFSYFKASLLLARENAGPAQGHTEDEEGTGGGDGDGDLDVSRTKYYHDEATNENITRLESLLEQRDNEIRILVAKLRRARGEGGTSDTSSSRSSTIRTPAATGPPAMTTTTRDLSPEEKKALLEQFKTESQAYPILDRTKTTLKDLYAQAQRLGQEVQEAKDIIAEIKRHMTRHQQEHLTEHIRSGLEEEDIVDPELDAMQSELQVCQTAYKSKLSKLRSLKQETEHLKHLFEKQKVAFQQEFQRWLDERPPTA